MEADLQRYYQIDLADYWRGKLSVRRLSVLVHRLPLDSATVVKTAELSPGWDTKAFLLADIFAAVTGEQHPARPSGEKKAKKARAARLRAQLEAQRDRVEARKRKEA